MAKDGPLGQVRKLDGHRDIPTRPGMRGRSLVGPGDGAHDLFVEDLIFEPGATIPLHRHPIVEAFVMLEGSLTVRLGDEETLVEAESTVSIPADMPHALANRGPTPARALSVAPWDRGTFFTRATVYLEGTPRETQEDR